ncbi:MAG: sulfatase-like hydrolase/transferase [Pseudomonadales bacterium]|nr:sulfatase-like hydrolase/transferase [Pseudomonadales bacterium]
MSAFSDKSLRNTYLIILMLLVVNLFYEATLAIGLFTIIRHFMAHFFIVTSIYIVCKTRSFRLFHAHALELIGLFILVYGLKLLCFYFVGMNYSPLALSALAVGSLLELLPLVLLSLIPKPYIIIYIALIVAFVCLNAFDTAYFYYTFSHVESVLFDNLNWSSIKGVVSLPLVVLAFSGAGLLFFLVKKQVKFSDKRSTARRLFSAKNYAFLLLICLVFDLVFSRLDAFMFQINPHDIHIERTKEVYRSKVAQPVWFNLLAVTWQYVNDDANDVSLKEFQAYTPDEADYLQRLDIIPVHQSTPINKTYSKIIFVVFESLPIDYIHYYNDQIPAEITPNFDRLLQKYPHIDNFFAANMPTNKGLNAIINSQLDYTPDFRSRFNLQNLFSILQHDGYAGYFLRGVSKFYSNEIITLPKLFKMQHFIAKEELDKKYPGSIGWGYSNDVIYTEAIELLKAQKQKGEKIFLFIKTIDLHDPGLRTGFRAEDHPAQVAKQEMLFKALYWADTQLGLLEEKLIKDDLFDDETLLIITSDHNPHPGGEFKTMAMSDDYHRVSRIPLIFMTKDGMFSAIKPDSFASQIDLAPTLLSLLGLDVPDYFMGRNLLQKPYEYALGLYDKDVYLHSASGTKKIPLNEENVASSAMKKWFNNMKTAKVLPLQ